MSKEGFYTVSTRDIVLILSIILSNEGMVPDESFVPYTRRNSPYISSSG